MWASAADVAARCHREGPVEHRQKHSAVLKPAGEPYLKMPALDGALMQKRRCRRAPHSLRHDNAASGISKDERPTVP